MKKNKTLALKLLREADEILSTKGILSLGIHPRILYLLRDEGLLEQISRGRYRLSELPGIENPDFITVASRSPKSVICLVSALSYYELTTQIPSVVSIALIKGSNKPVIDYPPIECYFYSKASFDLGITRIDMNGLSIQIYDIEKTIVDCFKFRNKIGLDVVLEAIKLYKSRENIKLNKLLEYANICRVKKIMIPYLEML